MTTTNVRPACHPSGLINSGRKRYASPRSSRASVERTIRARWHAIVRVAQSEGLPNSVCRTASTSLPKGRLGLLGSSSKVLKGSEGYLVAVQYLSGAAAWRKLCPESTIACRSTCLGHQSGRLAWDEIGKRPQAWRTALLLGAPEYYRALLGFELRSFAAKARREGLVSAVRLDGASDLGLASRFRREIEEAGIDRVWDYTKRPGHAWNALPDDLHDVTLSYPGDRYNGGSFTPWFEFVAAGGRLAVVSSDPMPKKWRGFPVVSGDDSDLRFLDPRGVIVWLSVKGSKRNARNANHLGFTVSADS